MGITGMMYTGLSGLTSTGRSIAVTGDNIANLNTIGFRGSRAVFEEVLNQSVLGVGELGGGTRVAQIEKLFHQGPIVQSAKPEDIAIQGRGFFVLDGEHNGVDGTYFSRAGSFGLDNQGFLSTAGGSLRVQGYSARNGVVSSQIGDLRLDRSIEPAITTTVRMEVNFDGYPIGTATPPPFDIADPATTSVFAQDTVIYDSQGTPRQVTMYFSRVDQDTWSWNMTAPSDEVVGGGPNPSVVVASGSLDFDTQGQLVNQTVTLDTIDFDSAAPGQQIIFSFDGSTNTTLSREPDQDKSTINVLAQDGYQAGNYIGMQVTDDGRVIGKYDNGQQITVGRIAMADFANQTALSRVGGSFFTPTPDSGEAVVGFAGAGGRGTLQGNALEQSNVDLSEEFVKLITDQRGYQAQSRTITTADELLSETVNLKR